MFEKRLITTLLDQVAVLSVTVEALRDDANRYSRGHEIEGLLKRATLNMLRACSNLSDLERVMTTDEEPTA